MKGVIFSAVQDAVERTFGPDACHDALDRAAVGGSYTSLGKSEDVELVSITCGLLPETGPEVADRLRWVGTNAHPTPPDFDITDIDEQTVLWALCPSGR
jgi:hypothetical protein